MATLLLCSAGGALYIHGDRERSFFGNAFVQLAGGRGNEPVADIKLGSGDSAAVILEHDCCSGAGFDAVAIRTSDGDEFYAKRNYCGLEGFYAALEAGATKDLNRFKEFLYSNGYQKR